MNRQKVAQELVAIAKQLLAIEFDTKEQMDKYLDEHPSANPRNHRVKKREKTKEERGLHFLD